MLSGKRRKMSQRWSRGKAAIEPLSVCRLGRRVGRYQQVFLRAKPQPVTGPPPSYGRGGPREAVKHITWMRGVSHEQMQSREERQV